MNWPPESRAALYIPKGFAHGFQTLTPETEVFYEMTVRFHPIPRAVYDGMTQGWGIVWPATKNERLVNQRDNDLPMLAAWKTAGK